MEFYKNDIQIINKKIIISGDQDFIIDNKNIIFQSNIKKYTIIKNLLKNYRKNCDSLIDIGCSNGLVSFLAEKENYKVLSLEKNLNCISILKIIKIYLNLSNIKISEYNFGNKINCQDSDIVCLFSLINLIFNCSPLFVTFDSIFQYLNKYVKKYLFIEWIDDCKKNIQNKEYNKINFENSLIKNIGQIVDRITLDGNTRILYIVKKHNKIKKWYNNHGIHINDIKNRLNELQKKIIIKHGNIKGEYVEQYLILKYINKKDKILEIGGNIGRTSNIIASILENDNQ